jgi:DNA-binding Lrp family transcriptional regulator
MEQIGKRSTIMVTAIVLLTVTKNRINEAAEEIAAIKEISEVYSITGQYDLAAIVRAPDNDTLANVITAQILKIEGVIKSETMFAFRVFSRHDLEGMFSVGIQ